MSTLDLKHDQGEKKNTNLVKKLVKTKAFRVFILGTSIGLGAQIGLSNHDRIQQGISDYFGKITTTQYQNKNTAAIQKTTVHYNKDDIMQVAKFISSDVTIPTSINSVYERTDIPEFLNLRKYFATRGIKIDNMNSEVLLGFDLDSKTDTFDFAKVDEKMVVITPPPVKIEYVIPLLKSIDLNNVKDHDSLFKDVDSVDTIKSLIAMEDAAKKEVMTDDRKKDKILEQAKSNLINLFKLTYPDKKIVVDELTFSKNDSDNQEK